MTTKGRAVFRWVSMASFVAWRSALPWRYDADVSRVNDARLVFSQDRSEQSLALTMVGGDIVLARARVIVRHDEALPDAPGASVRAFVRTPPHRDHADRRIVITQIAAS